MAKAPFRGTELASLARRVLISMAAGVAIVFGIFMLRREFWSWRLALYGVLGGLSIHLSCHLLEKVVGRRVRGWRLFPEPAVGVLLYFVGGCIGGLAATGALRAAGLMPFELSGRDLRLALSISGGVAIVAGLLFHSFEVMRNRLSESIERIKEQEFAEKELDLARSIQQRLLPPPEIVGDGYRIAARNLAARFVAGDFYDVFHLADGSLGIVVADVSGKGMGAALIMASVKAILPLLAEGRTARQMLVELNRKLLRELAPREFVALAFARYVPSTGRLELANAGLPDPYRLRAGCAPEPLEVRGPRLPLGALAAVEYESLETTLEAFDRVLLLTDGLPEAPAAEGDPLGYSRLASLLESRQPETPGAFLDRVFASVRAATQPTLEDDWTALVLEARPAGVL